MKRIFRIFVSGIVSFILPLLLYRLPWSFLPAMKGRPHNLFMLFAFTVSLFIIWNLYIEYKKYRIQNLSNWLPIVLPMVIIFQTLFQIREYPVISKDYQLVEQATTEILAGKNPYGTWYNYPPLVCQTHAFIHRQLMAIGTFIPYFHVTDDQARYLRFYIFQCIQFFLVVSAYFLMLRLAANLGVTRESGLFLVSLLFLANNPLWRTVEYNQINTYLLNIVIIVILYVSSHPLWSGAAIALGGHIKLYPLLFLVPSTIVKGWKVIAGVVSTFIGIMLLQTGFGKNWLPWQQFVEFYRSIGLITWTNKALRENSIHSLLYNTTHQLELILGKDGIPNENLVMMGVALVNIIFAIWFVWRYLKWRRIYRDQSSLLLRVLCMDTLAAMLLFSPLVWEHHYIIIMPFSLWIMITLGNRYPLQVGLSHLLIYMLPTFDIYPFSYHRLAGLLLLLFTASPKNIENRILDDIQVRNLSGRITNAEPLQ